MAKGATAKLNIEKKLQETFGEDYIGVYDKKVYLWADDGGERVQIAITMTCPKAPVGGPQASGDLDFVAMSAEPAKPQAEITPDEQKNIEDLMARLNLL